MVERGIVNSRGLFPTEAGGNCELLLKGKLKPLRGGARCAVPLRERPISSLDIIPARGWIQDENGDVILVSYDPTQTGVQRQRQNVQPFQP